MNFRLFIVSLATLSTCSLIFSSRANSLSYSCQSNVSNPSPNLYAKLKQSSGLCYESGTIVLKFLSNNEVVLTGYLPAGIMEQYGKWSKNDNVYTVNWYKSCISRRGCNPYNSSSRYIVTLSGNLRADTNNGGLFTPCN